MYTCLREWPSVAANTLNSNGSPSRSAILIDSFQSNCSRRPGGVSKRGWGSGPSAGPMAMPFLRVNWVNALYPASFSSGCLCSSRSWMPFFVTPGGAALASISPMWRSKEPGLSRPPSGGSQPSAFQYAATVCLSRRYRLAISLKLGFMPDSLYMFSSPIMSSPTAGSFRKTSTCSARA